MPVVVVVFFCFVWGLSFFHKFFFTQRLVGSYSCECLPWVDWHSVHGPVNHAGFNRVKVDCLEVAVVLKQVLAHFVNFVRVSGNLFMENACPHKCIKFVLVLNHSLAVDVKVEVKIAADAEQVIFDVLNFFKFSEHLDVLHFCCDKLIEAVNELFA